MLITALLLGMPATQAWPQPIIPKPASVRFNKMMPFEFTSKTSIKSDCKASKFLTDMLKKAGGITLAGNNERSQVVFKQKSDTGRLRPDWYWMTVTPNQILVEYSNDTGAFYAVQTLRQLLPVQIESPKVVKGVKWTVPSGSIEDGPRFPWRGMMLDESRHFFGMAYVKKTLDRLAFLKQNTFHWHLVDDGGWRIEIKKYPRLTDFGAWRMDTGEVWPGGRWNYANVQFVGSKHPKKYGGFYTQAQIKEIVKYAADRHITIVPEIEMPGHALAAVTSYPELACDNVAKADKPGMSVSNVYCAGKDSSIEFIQNVLDEVLALFPSRFVHIGADEVLKDYWHNCPKCQARMNKLGLKDEHELQSWFVRTFDSYLTSKGRRLVGWDEILEGGLAPGATVMSWRGVAGGVAAAKAGRDVVMSPTSHCYFDYSYQAIPTEHVYRWNPVPSELDTLQGSKVMGGQYNVWTEWIADTKRCDELQYPRALAMAEVLWSPPEDRKTAEFMSRQVSFLSRLEALDINYHLPAPTVAYQSIFFEGSTTVEATQDPSMPLKLRYTLDGTTPKSDSPVYEGPLTVTKSCTVTFAYVGKQGQAGDLAKVACQSFVSTDHGKLEPGLSGARHLLGATTTKLPDLQKMKPNSTFKAETFDENERPRPEGFGVAWTGFLVAPIAGEYTFSLTSDDGSVLTLNDAIVVDNDGPHGAVTKTGTAWLKAGTYRLYVGWFDQGGANSFKVEAAGPNSMMGPVPTRWLWRSKD